jgi:hypothetical protein
MQSRIIYENTLKDNTRAACKALRQTEELANRITNSNKGIGDFCDGWIVEEEKLHDQIRIFECLLKCSGDCNAYLVQARIGYYVLFAPNENLLFDLIASVSAKVIRESINEIRK